MQRHTQCCLLKSTKVQTLGELRMRRTANGGLGYCIGVYSRSPASSSQRVWHWLATVVDSMRESMHTLRCGFLCLQRTQSKRIRSSRLIHACAPLIDGLDRPRNAVRDRGPCQFVALERQQNRHFIFLAHVPLKLFESASLPVVRIVVDRHTDRHTRTTRLQ